MKKIILAYSGGLDTSCCIRWLKDRGYEVIAFLADLGQPLHFATLKKRALAIGASRVYVKDLKAEFVKDFIYPALKANAVYESKYFLSAALGRPLIAKHLVKIAHKEKARYVAHGCTGKGNDQVRFEIAISCLDPKLEIIAPLRLWNLKSREEEIRYAKRCRLPVDVGKGSPYSIDRNLWGTSIECGILEDPALEPPQDIYQMTDLNHVPKRPYTMELYFEKGVPKKIDKKSYDSISLILKLNAIGGKFAVGRSDLVENRLIGIKSREIYEAPAAYMLHLAHRDLESLVLDRELLHFKELVSLKYSELIYYGLWYSPLKSALDRFIDSTQQNITGTVKLKLYRGSSIVVGRSSRFSLYKKELATYGDKDKFDSNASEGFIKIWGMPYKSQMKT